MKRIAISALLFASAAVCLGDALFGPFLGQLSSTGAGNNGAAAVVCNPLTDVAGIKVWLKIDSLNGTSNGSSISAWNDSSTNALNFSQATGATQPTYSTTGGPGSTPAVVFTGGSQYMASATMTQAQPITVFIILQTTVTGAVSPFVWGTGGSASMSMALSNGKYSMNAGTALNNTVNADTNWHVWAGIFNTTSSEFWIDGGAAAAGPATTGSGSFSTQAMDIGTAASNTSIGWKGDVTDLLVYSGALTVGQINTVANCIAGLRGLTWTTAF